MIDDWNVGGATRQSGGNWAGRFILPEDLAAWYVTNGRYLEQGQMATIGDALLKWDGSAFKIIDATFASAAAADAWVAKVGAPIATNSTATIAGTLVRYGGAGVGWVGASGPLVYGRRDLPVLTKAISDCRAGLSDAKICFIGDSKTLGFANGTLPLALNSFPRFFSGVIEPKLNCAEGLAAWNDTRWVLASGWSLGTAGGTIGIANGAFHGNTANTVTFTPGWGDCDKYTIYYVTTGTTAGATVQATGGASVAINKSDAPSGISEKTFFAASASQANVITITGANTGDIYILGISGASSTKKSLLFSNFGWSGSKYSDWSVGASTPYGSTEILKKYVPHCVVIALGTNEAGDALPVSTYEANATALVTAYKACGADIVLADPLQSNSAAHKPFELAYCGALDRVASALDVARLRWQSDLPAVQGGYYDNMADELHRNTYGNADIASWLGDNFQIA